MGRRLATAVHLTHPETHEPLILQPGDEPDEALAAVITNPGAWEPDEDETEGGDGGEGESGPDAGGKAEPKTRQRARKQADE
ncbi:hypothetical protein [Streptomyces sp. H51]|uniref:hypothetical protein n=1 Tax=Streptomyces sp. H51 TaxID=3111770 RepID=UPI002D76A623|nr:hypothetical protein [Streptomyces sp. H51]